MKKNSRGRVVEFLKIISGIQNATAQKIIDAWGEDAKTVYDYTRNNTRRGYIERVSPWATKPVIYELSALGRDAILGISKDGTVHESITQMAIRTQPRDVFALGAMA
jgi:hypothetical protein